MMRSKEDLEKEGFPEKQGTIDIFVCASCRNCSLYIYINDGIAPQTVPCPVCKGRAYSVRDSILQPCEILLWSRPEDEEQLSEITDRAHELMGGIKSSMSREELYRLYLYHYNSGGLFAHKFLLEKTDA